MNARDRKCCKNQEKGKNHLKLELDLGGARQTWSMQKEERCYSRLRIEKNVLT